MKTKLSPVLWLQIAEVTVGRREDPMLSAEMYLVLKGQLHQLGGVDI